MGYWVFFFVFVSFWCLVGVFGNGFFYDCFLDEFIYVVDVDFLEECICLCWYELLCKVFEVVGEMLNWGFDFGEDCGCGVVFMFLFGVVVVEVVEVMNIF